MSELGATAPAAVGARLLSRGVRPAAFAVYGAVALAAAYVGLALHYLSMIHRVEASAECPGSGSRVSADVMEVATVSVSHPPTVVTCTQGDGIAVTYWLSFPSVMFFLGAALLMTAVALGSIRVYMALR